MVQKQSAGSRCLQHHLFLPRQNYQYHSSHQAFSKQHVNIPTDSHGNLTGHLIGLLYRALLCKELGVNTVWVFDGKPPSHKLNQLYRRRQIKEEAAEKTESALEEGDVDQAVKQKKRTIFVTETEREDAKTLIRLMGIVVEMQECLWFRRVHKPKLSALGCLRISWCKGLLGKIWILQCLAALL